MVGFIKKMFIGLLSVCRVVSFTGPLASNFKEPLKCVTFNNQQCQARPTVVDINFNEILFYSFTVSVNNCGGSCNTICSGLCSK